MAEECGKRLVFWLQERMVSEEAYFLVLQLTSVLARSRTRGRDQWSETSICQGSDVHVMQLGRQREEV